LTDTSTETKSIGLLADALVVMVFATSLTNFIATGQLLPIYLDSAVWTTLSWHENSRPSTGTLQKPMPTPTQTATPYTTGPLAFMTSLFRDSLLITWQLRNRDRSHKC